MAMQNIYNYSKPKMVPTKINSLEAKVDVKDVKKVESKADQYLAQKVMTAKPEELTYMLYEGLVKFIKQGILYNDDSNIEKTHESIMRSQAIVTELDVTLDREYALSEGLAQMYDYMNRRLTDANLTKDTSILQEVLGYAETLKDTWKQAMVLAR